MAGARPTVTRILSAGGRDEDDIGIDGVAAGAMGAAAAIGQQFDALNRAAEAEADAGMLQRIAEAVADVLVEAA